MNKPLKTKLQLTLKGHDAELLDAAIRVTEKHTLDEPFAARRQWVVQWAIRAVARAIIAAKKMPCPLAVQLRFEFQEEMEARVALHRAYEVQSDSVAANSQMLALADQLTDRATQLREICQTRAAGTLPAVYLTGSRWN